MVGQTFRSVRASSRTRFRVTESARHEREPVVVDVGRGIRLSASSQTLQFSTTATRSNTLTSHCRKSNELADRFVSWIVAEQCHASVGGPIFSVQNFPSGAPGVRADLPRKLDSNLRTQACPAMRYTDRGSQAGRETLRHWAIRAKL
jgi:hypothetical protein